MRLRSVLKNPVPLTLSATLPAFCPTIYPSGKDNVKKKEALAGLIQMALHPDNEAIWHHFSP